MIGRFLKLLAEATERVPRHYFQLPVAGLEDPIFRERVYSYELYHHLRALLDEDGELASYVLSGEINKAGHPIIRPCAPDFVLHHPGGMNGNLVAIEVKPINANHAGIEKDRRTLEYFIGNARYQWGVQLVYGGNEHELKPFLDTYRDANERVKLLWHPAPGRPAIPVAARRTLTP